MHKLTERQAKALDFIRRKTEVDGVPPTLRELCLYMGYRSIGSAQDVVSALRKKGFLTVPDRQTARSFLLTERGKAAETASAAGSQHSSSGGGEEVFWVPKLGSVPAGHPLESIESFSGRLPLSIHSLPKPHPHPKLLFSLQVKGDSMIDAGILDGDWLIVKKQASVDPGAIVVALVDNEATVKRLMKDQQKGWYLKPENERYAPIYGRHQSFKIIGKIIALHRVQF